MTKHLAIFVISLVLPITFATEGIRECPGVPLPKVEVKGCDKVPCILQRGEDAEFVAHFVSPADSEDLETKVHFKEIQSGISGSFPLLDGKGKTCDWLEGSECPIYEGEETAFKLAMPVLKLYPKNMELDLKIYVENENKDMITCFQLLATTSG